MSAPWQADAVCAELPEADLVFYPPADSTRDVYAPARRVCATCPVLAECRVAVLKSEDERSEYGRFGFCAGLTPTQRARTSTPDVMSPEARLARIDAKRLAKNLYNRQRNAGGRPPTVTTRVEIIHGTENGYSRHRLLDEPACGPCKAAKAKAQRIRRVLPKTTRRTA